MSFADDIMLEKVNTTPALSLTAAFLSDLWGKMLYIIKMDPDMPFFHTTHLE